MQPQLDFVTDDGERPSPVRSAERTGWEDVIFALEDEAHFEPGPAGQS